MIDASVSSAGVGVSVPNWVAVLLIVAAVVTALTILSKAAKTVTRRVVQAAAVASKLDLLLKEFKPNGGTSLRDAVDTTSRRVEELHAALDAHAANDLHVQTTLSEQIAALTK